MTLARWNGQIQTLAGAAVPSAYVEVRRLDGLTLEPLYSDREGTTPKSNPFQADSSGYAFFHAAGGAFRLRAYATGFERVWDYVGVGLGSESDMTAETFPADVADVLIALGAKTVPVNGDSIVIIDSADDDTPKLVTFENLKKLFAFPIAIAASDETTALTTGTAKATYHLPRAFTVLDVMGELSTAQASGSTFTVDINENGTSILSTKLTIDNTEKTSLTAAAPPVISDAALAAGSTITIDIDQIGNGSAKGLKVWAIGYWT